MTGSGDEGTLVDSVSLGSLVVGNTVDQNAEGGIEVLNANSTEKTERTPQMPTASAVSQRSWASPISAATARRKMGS